MSKKISIQVVIALVVLGAVLIFLGVNFVPQIYASSTSGKSLVVNSNAVRAEYVNEAYPRSITSQLSYRNSDWIERHPTNYYEHSDWVDRHTSNFYLNSDWIERHPNE